MAPYIRQALQTEAAPAALGPYSQAVRAGEILFISGQLPLEPRSMELVAGPFRAQVEQAVQNIEAITRTSGGSLDQVIKLTVYLTDLARFGEVNEVLTEYFTEPYPARAVIGAASLPKGAAVEIEAIVHTGPGVGG